jgi:protein-L-isoaspartate(D-aspartate) O-methyltransferase
MDAAPEFFADARNRMVDSQLRPNKVTDPRILHAMRTLPRERFLPPHLASLAYADEDVPLGGGRFLMEPMVLARLLQAAAPVAGDTALVVGAGTGYGAAVLAGCGVRVTALEEDAALRAEAQSALTTLAPNVMLVSGALAAGYPAGAPYDIILLEGAVAAIPPAFEKQLRTEGGRLVGVIARSGATSDAVLAEVTPAGLRAAAIFDCAIKPLPSLMPPPVFVF